MEKIKKYDNLLIWLGIAIFATTIIFQIQISTGDELWNFQNIYKMVNGYTIYKDANVIITPIFFLIGELVLKILGANYFIYRLFGVCIYSTMILIIYNILKQLKIKRKSALLYTLILNYFIYTIIMGGANYNILALTFILLGIYILLKYRLTGKCFILLNSIVIYLTIFTKQNMGIYYLIGNIIIQYIIGKKDIKNTIINIIKQIIILFVLSSITLVIFKLNGNLGDFINYAFLGIKEFGSNNIALDIMCIIHIAVAIITLICAIFVKNKIANEEQKRNIEIFLFIGIPILLMIYPIINSYHTMLAILILAVLLMYLVDIILKEFLNSKITSIIIIFLLIVFLLISLQAIIRIIKYNPFTLEYNNPYYGVYVPEEINNKITNINKYIKENNEKVIIFSKESALYNIPVKRSNGAMDLPFLGNLGYGGAEQMLKNIKSKTGYKILLTKENYWQESDSITNYIKEHYTKIGEIEEFEIYEIL